MGNRVTTRSRCEMDSTAQENLNQKSPCTDCKGNYSEDGVSPGTNLRDEQSNGNGLPLIGEHENQISEGGEIDLHQHYNKCKKNPGHPEFIPIESFSLNHLPEGHHDSDLYELIKAAADLTVRVSVTMTSPDRPKFWPGTKIPYYLSDMKGKKTMRAGTGRVWLVVKYTDEDKQTCPCDKCKASDKPSKVWWKIFVATAAHVVFDDIEASHTTLRLFYDREDSPLVILKDKVHVYYVEIKDDRCVFTCVTCDEILANKLKKMEEHFYNLCEKVQNKYIESRDIHKLNFIVSHPHGCSKQASVGQWKNLCSDNPWDWGRKFTYRTCTCPGSSGASVHCVGFNYTLSTAQVHSGSLKSGLNYSGAGGVHDFYLSRSRNKYDVGYTVY